ncbi:MAG TPA: GTP-binding protein, partial [Oscillospiraceae bacterium]|nr:GTP-binding protein [Oscillospiraceae bacterium]
MSNDIRNVCLLGHGGSGKTSLAESMLYLTGGTDRLGRVPDGNTVCDSDPEEVKRQITIALSVAPVTYNKTKINVINTPGYFDFAGEVVQALAAADAGVILCAAKGGLSVGAERAWKLLAGRRMPRLFYISKTDEENGDFEALLDELKAKYGTCICPLYAPIFGDHKRVLGIVDVITGKAYEAKGGKAAEIQAPPEAKALAETYREALMEKVAESDEELMEKFFDGAPFTEAEILKGIRAGVSD